MRFVLAIVLFVCALASTGLGIAQRTVLAGPSQVVAAGDVSSTAPLTVIDGATLGAFAGNQSLTVNGSGPIYVAYGRTADVKAWVGKASYNKVGYSAAKAKLTGKLVAGTEKQTPSPKGSDLWLADRTAQNQLVWPLQLPADYSVIIAGTDGKAAPGELQLRWPLDNSAPFSSTLIVAGIGLMILGLIAFVWALINARRRRGPRRKQPKLPRPPRPPQLTARTQRALPVGPSRGRRRTLVAVPVVLAGTLLLSGCSNGDLGTLFGQTPTPTPSPSASSTAAPDLPPVAVTGAQLSRIMVSVSKSVADADAALDDTKAAVRLAGPALAERTANYKIRKADGNQPADAAIPAKNIEVMLPQQNAKWPRTVFAVVGDPAAKTVAPLALMLMQESPRDDYKVIYSIALESGAVVPDLAPPTVGAPRVADDVKYLSLAPDKLAAAYYDILTNGENAARYDLFDAKGDKLRTELGPEYRAAAKAALPASAGAEFSLGDATAPTIVFGTNDTGAIVALDVHDVATVKPSEAGSAVNPTGQVKLLSGLAQTTKGVTSTYGLQLLFYVPQAADKNAKIRLLGYTQGLISSTEVH